MSIKYVDIVNVCTMFTSMSGVIYTWLCITGYPEVLKQYDILCMVCYDIVFFATRFEQKPICISKHSNISK